MEMKDVTRIFDVVYYQQANFPKKDALTAKINGEWVPTSTEKYIENANLASKGLLKLGIKPGDKVAMISNNRPEWCMMDVGIAQIGAINVPVYPTISEADYKFIFNDAEVKLCFVSDEEILGKVNQIKSEVPSLEGVYTFNDIKNEKHWSEVTKLGADGDDEEVQKLKDAVNPKDLATLIYT
jgi:long-chain acyl-CoA synthetase